MHIIVYAGDQNYPASKTIFMNMHACKKKKKQDLKNCQKSKTKPASLAKAAEGLAPGAVEPAAGDLAHGPGRRFGPMTRGLNK